MRLFRFTQLRGFGISLVLKVSPLFIAANGIGTMSASGLYQTASHDLKNIFLAKCSSPSCTKVGKKLCGQCHSLHFGGYCSADCQRSDWNRHKTFCKAYSPTAKRYDELIKASANRPSSPSTLQSALAFYQSLPKPSFSSLQQKDVQKILYPLELRARLLECLVRDHGEHALFSYYLYQLAQFVAIYYLQSFPQADAVFSKVEAFYLDASATDETYLLHLGDFYGLMAEVAIAHHLNYGQPISTAVESIFEPCWNLFLRLFPDSKFYEEEAVALFQNSYGGYLYLIGCGEKGALMQKDAIKFFENQLLVHNATLPSTKRDLYNSKLREMYSSISNYYRVTEKDFAQASHWDFRLLDKEVPDGQQPLMDSDGRPLAYRTCQAILHWTQELQNSLSKDHLGLVLQTYSALYEKFQGPQFGFHLHFAAAQSAFRQGQLLETLASTNQLSSSPSESTSFFCTTPIPSSPSPSSSSTSTSDRESLARLKEAEVAYGQSEELCGREKRAKMHSANQDELFACLALLRDSTYKRAKMSFLSQFRTGKFRAKSIDSLREAARDLHRDFECRENDGRDSEKSRDRAMRAFYFLAVVQDVLCADRRSQSLLERIHTAYFASYELAHHESSSSNDDDSHSNNQSNSNKKEKLLWLRALTSYHVGRLENELEFPEDGEGYMRQALELLSELPEEFVQSRCKDVKLKVLQELNKSLQMMDKAEECLAVQEVVKVEEEKLRQYITKRVANHCK